MGPRDHIHRIIAFECAIFMLLELLFLFARNFCAMSSMPFAAGCYGGLPRLEVESLSLAEHAAKRRIISAGAPNFADAGCVIGYGANTLNLYRRVGYFVDKIFKGAKPADIPVERPTRFEMIINLKAAKALGIKIPQSILVRADKVIE